MREIPETGPAGRETLATLCHPFLTTQEDDIPPEQWRSPVLLQQTSLEHFLQGRSWDNLRTKHSESIHSGRGGAGKGTSAAGGERSNPSPDQTWGSWTWGSSNTSLDKT